MMASPAAASLQNILKPTSKGTNLVRPYSRADALVCFPSSNECPRLFTLSTSKSVLQEGSARTPCLFGGGYSAYLYKVVVPLRTLRILISKDAPRSSPIFPHPREALISLLPQGCLDPPFDPSPSHHGTIAAISPDVRLRRHVSLTCGCCSRHPEVVQLHRLDHVDHRQRHRPCSPPASQDDTQVGDRRLVLRRHV